MTSSQQPKLVPPGRLVAIGEVRLHALLRGQGSPVVVLEPALGGFALQYKHIQEKVSVFTRVLAYDRAGQGWSDPSPNPRTPANLAIELRALLGSLNLQPPYVLVGHSLGGLLTRCYAGFYPDEVAGVILVDSSHEHQHGNSPDLDKNLNQASKGVRLQKFINRLGLGKQLTKLSLGEAAKLLPSEDLDTFISVASQPKHQEAMLAEFSQHRCYFGLETQVPRTLGDIPLIVITAGKSVSGQRKVGGVSGDEVNTRHQRLQKQLVTLSSRSEQIVIPEATHLSILTHPDHVGQVVAAIQRVVEGVRGGT